MEMWFTCLKNARDITCDVLSPKPASPLKLPSWCKVRVSRMSTEITFGKDTLHSRVHPFFCAKSVEWRTRTRGIFEAFLYISLHMGEQMAFLHLLSFSTA